MKNQFYLLCGLFLLVAQMATAQTTYTINDPEELTDLSATLAAGDTVILADGTYTSDERIKFSPTTGTAASPITFRSETPGGVKFTGGLQMNIGGDYVIVDGFHWQGGYGASNFIQFRDGFVYANHSTIQNCAIDGLTVNPDDLETGTSVKHRWIVLYGTYNTVINCSFMNKKNAGALVLVELEFNASPDEVENTRCDIVGHRISNNYFYKYSKIDPTLTNAGDSETIRVGTSEYQNVNSSTTVNNNYFVEADGENEIITNKSKNNTYINNTFRRSRGSLVLRHGSEATVDGNYFLGEAVDGTGGIRIVDSNHNITNNYIQDCIDVTDQAIWNNGITFLGGGDRNAVVCSSTSVSNGYQKVENITLSNNTIINTNAPLFYNTSKGANSITGTVSNNLIYFDAGNSNLTDVISGNTPSSYTSLGTKLDYTGNVYNGTTLGVTNTGFTENTGITTTPNGEIFTFSGATGKGADMGSYTPTTDSMVGFGIGACFLDYLGAKITNTECEIVVGDYLTVGSLPIFTPPAASKTVSVNANVSWTAVSNDNWISIDTNSGTGDATVSATVTENIDIVDRTGTITFTQDPGGDDIVRILTITQEGKDPTDDLNLINRGVNGAPVTIDSFSKEEVDIPAGKTNYATNTLDKDDSTNWVADDQETDGEFIIYDLDSPYTLDLIEISTNSKSDAYGFQIWVSTTGTEVNDFTRILPTTGNYLFTAASSTDFNKFPLNGEAATYVKVIGFGRFSNTTTGLEVKSSVWTTITEINFYGKQKVLSNNDYSSTTSLGINLYPNPVTEDILYIESSSNDFKTVKVSSVLGRNVLEVQLNANNTVAEIDLSALKTGLYFVEISNGKQKAVKKILISK